MNLRGSISRRSPQAVVTRQRLGRGRTLRQQARKKVSGRKTKQGLRARAIGLGTIEARSTRTTDGTEGLNEFTRSGHSANEGCVSSPPTTPRRVSWFVGLA